MALAEASALTRASSAYIERRESNTFKFIFIGHDEDIVLNGSKIFAISFLGAKSNETQKQL